MFLVGSPPISVRLRRNSRAKRMTLRLSRLDGQATLTIPARVSDTKARKFLEEQEGWLQKQVASAPVRQTVQVGGSILYRGRPCDIVAGKRTAFDGVQLTAPETNTSARLRAFLKAEARDMIVPLMDRYAASVQRPVNRLTLRDTRSRWGSCSADGNLMFSWRLIMAPPIVFDYVVAHEVAHLVEMNHSAAFWRVVEDLMPDYKNHRGWLREHGALLHAADFTS